MPPQNYVGSDSFYWNGTDASGFRASFGTGHDHSFAACAVAPVLRPIRRPLPAASAQSSSSILLVWTDSTTGANVATSYSISISTNGTTYSPIATAGAGATSATITGLSDGTIYSFKINGINGFSTSGDSNIVSTSTLVQAPVVILLYGDDRGPYWTSVGNWGNSIEPGRYYNNGHSYAIGGKGADVATWTFTNLVPGRYRISATWRGDTNRATNAPFTILDGSSAFPVVRINQQLAPSGLSDQGFSWTDFGGPYNITGSPRWWCASSAMMRTNMLTRMPFASMPHRQSRERPQIAGARQRERD